MKDFVFCSPTQFVFGHGAVDKTGEYVAQRNWGRGLLVYGGGSVERLGTLDRVRVSLREAGVDFLEFGGIRPNPEVNQVREAIEFVRSEGIDFILPVGGGSVIDAAKAIAYGTLYDGDVWDFHCKKATVTRALPIAAVLTIPAAGSESSSSCVISNDELGLKNGTNGDAFRPAIAIMDPELTFTLPQYQTAAGVTDMIAHICERYFSGEGPAPVSDNICTGLIRAIMEAAEVVMDEPEDYDARATIMWAAPWRTTTLRVAVWARSLLPVPAAGKAMAWSMRCPRSIRKSPTEPAWRSSCPHGCAMSGVKIPCASSPSARKCSASSPSMKATKPWRMPSPSSSTNCSASSSAWECRRSWATSESPRRTWIIW